MPIRWFKTLILLMMVAVFLMEVFDTGSSFVRSHYPNVSLKETKAIPLSEAPSHEEEDAPPEKTDISSQSGQYAVLKNDWLALDLAPTSNQYLLRYQHSPPNAYLKMNLRPPIG